MQGMRKEEWENLICFDFVAGRVVPYGWIFAFDLVVCVEREAQKGQGSAGKPASRIRDRFRCQCQFNPDSLQRETPYLERERVGETVQGEGNTAILGHFKHLFKEHVQHPSLSPPSPLPPRSIPRVYESHAAHTPLQDGACRTGHSRNGKDADADADAYMFIKEPAAPLFCPSATSFVAK